MQYKTLDQIDEARMMQAALEKEAEKQELARKQAELLAEQKEQEMKAATENPQYADQADELAEERVKLMKYSQRRGEVADRSQAMVKEQQQRVLQLQEQLKVYSKIPIADKTWVDPFEDYINGVFVPNKDKKPKKKGK